MSTRQIKNRVSAAINRRWTRARPGSVLILVVALLVLLALIGTAYLSSTQGERYTSAQNQINTEADLLLQGVVDTLNGTIANGLSGNVDGTPQYRPPQPEMPIPVVPTPATPKIPDRTGYANFDYVGVDPLLKPADPDPADLFLGSRIPQYSASTGTIIWPAISWPLFKDNNLNSTFDSPSEASTTTYLALNKPKIVSIPTVKTINGQDYPGLLYYIPSPAGTTTIYLNASAGPVVVPAPGAYLTPSGIISAPGTPVPAVVLANPSAHQDLINYAASVSGDGIADAGFVKLPLGQVDGITYFAATRVVDGNSAINASSAWSKLDDTLFTPAPVSFPNNPTTNFGLFRTNVGLQELLHPPLSTATSATAVTEMAALNNYRFFQTITPPTALTPTLQPFLSTPAPDATFAASAPINFSWYSYGDALEHQMTARAQSPGYNTTGPATFNQFQWLGFAQTAALAYKYSLSNPNSSVSALEQVLPNELGQSPSTPYSPSQVSQWYLSNFYSFSNPVVAANPPASFLVAGTNASVAGFTTTGSPLRTLLVGSNAVSNSIPSRMGNIASGAPQWVASTATTPSTYKFGDWVTSNGKTYVCLCDHTASLATASLADHNGPGTGVDHLSAVGLWAGVQGPNPVVPNLKVGMPYTHLPTKASVNTAPFEHLWLNFCELMTDSISKDPANAAALPQWQPPMLANGTAVNGEYQLPMFRNVIRNTSAIPTTKLSSAQMLKLRAALAAVNTLDMRDGDDDVSSRRIVLNDDAGTPQYDVEVYGTELQPYIGQIYIHVDATPANNFIAIQLVNPSLTKDITVGANWQFGTIMRGTTARPFTVTSVATGAVTLLVPKANATTHAPGFLVLTDGTPPAGYTPPTPATVSQPVIGLATAIGRELVLLKPRLASGATSTQTVPAGVTGPYFGDYYNEANLADLVPVDQVDTTTLVAPGDYYHRRGSDPTTNSGWNFVFPGRYSATATIASGFVLASGPPMAGNPDMGVLTGGAADLTGVNGTAPTFSTVPVVLNANNMAGPNPLDPTTPAAIFEHPFGGFMRDGDLLQIPFIGSYRIRAFSPGNTDLPDFVEMNSVTTDTSLAQDTDPAIQPVAGDTYNTAPLREQLGRFCPVGDPGDSTTNPPVTPPTMDFINDPVTGPANWHYHWAKRIFDYFTIQSPTDLYYPNADPAGPDPVNLAVREKYPRNGTTRIPVAMNTIANADLLGVEGRININTAPLPVLAQVPFVTPTAVGVAPAVTAAKAIQMNAAIAQAIIDYRDGTATVPGKGPFHSIFDLYKVAAFRTQNETTLNRPANDPPGPNQGIFSPNGLKTQIAPVIGNGVRFDFNERFLLLNNISNLITTRSDTFTCYVLLQGWRNVGTATPTLAVQRRAAFLLDRNVVTPTNNKPFNFKVPTD